VRAFGEQALLQAGFRHEEQSLVFLR
jgi:hypothetical protein